MRYLQLQYVVPPAPREHEQEPAKAADVPIAVIKPKAATSLMALFSMMFSFFWELSQFDVEAGTIPPLLD